jgi:putative aminopeptidase FrvX
VNVDLRRLLSVPGVSGPGYLRDELAPLYDGYRVDRLGTRIATNHDTGGPTMLLATHMDEHRNRPMWLT